MKKIAVFLVGACSIVLLAGCQSTKKEQQTESKSSDSIIVKSTSMPSISKATSETTSTSSSTSSEASITSESQSSSQKEAQKNKSIVLNDNQKGQITNDFLGWASQRAEIGNMAVSDWYFDHGAAGKGDWYANTPDGQVQVQNNGYPGFGSFAIHAIGGCVFYTAKDGNIGKQELFADSFATNYSAKMDWSKPVSKYLLGDNGMVYELKTGNGTPVSTNTGFGEYNDEGTQMDYPPTLDFQISEDTAAQAKLQELISAYQ
ncbi:hypothetical protein [Enterococcus hermanniensis]|uniref:Lipoprotein n=1 Tax=Enterococcus hermanniensis TaxID=249189 RepID=A0A1L8TMU0_9ENTE|nr:hypothetical protein [Enterococcus hermanniensis]OJG45607.1 hypothetical protein RV04_GL001896 [Enterococcus hermanniensis]